MTDNHTSTTDDTLNHTGKNIVIIGRQPRLSLAEHHLLSKQKPEEPTSRAFNPNVLRSPNLSRWGTKNRS